METFEQPRKPGRPRLNPGTEIMTEEETRTAHLQNVERGFTNELKRRKASVEFLKFEFRPLFNRPKRQNMAKLDKVERVNATGSIHRKMLYGAYPMADAQRLASLSQIEAWKYAYEHKWTKVKPPDEI